jgi:hypothetical protein
MSKSLGAARASKIETARYVRSSAKGAGTKTRAGEAARAEEIRSVDSSVDAEKSPTLTKTE